MAKRTRRSKTFITTVVFILIVIFVALCYFYPPFLAKIRGLFSGDDGNTVVGEITYVNELEDLRIHFVDVGQGDAILIELPDGKNVIIDSGKGGSSDKNESYQNLKNYISENTDIIKFDYAIATHADSDHIGNFDDILRDFEVKYFYRPYVYYSGTTYEFSNEFNKGASAYKQSSKTYGDFLELVSKETYYENGAVKNAGWEFFTSESDFAGRISYNETIYEYRFDFLTPKVNDLSAINYSDANDYSPIIKFTYCGVDVLFTGDAEKDAEADFVSHYKNRTDLDLDVDVLKVGHHGSSTSTTQALLDLVKPEYSVIQCGVDNSYHHPRQATINRLIGANSTIFRNDLHGDILLTITSSGTFNFATQVVNPDNVLVGGDILYA